ncbi:MAG TPA: MSHA biogenesis protein MshK [Burkholderiaceae bacterium]
MGKLTICIALAAGISRLAAAQTENLPDPTKPPAAFVHGEAVPAGPVLQSILIAPTHRLAVISGKTVYVGDSVEGAKVASIAENEVVLQSGKGRQVLRLYPSLRKPATDRASGAKPGGSDQQK